jgi:D-alanyl-D-alanine carboxypeptidase/D-alanyl-D-alanine-endopeptidase (penicillin-binding protein 4)
VNQIRDRIVVTVVAAVAGCGVLLPAALAQPPREPEGALATQLEKILTSYADKKVQFAGRVVALPSGEVLYDHDGERAMMPASNEKLVIMAAAVDQLGKDYQFKTVLAIRGKDLLVIGGGDPTIGDEKLAKAEGKPITAELRAWAEKLKAAGVKQIPGNIVIDDSIFDRQFTHPNWPGEQFESWYEAPVGGLNFNANCVDVSVQPTQPGKPAQVAAIPSDSAVKIVNQTTTGKKHSVRVSRTKGGDTLVVSGSVARSDKLGNVTVRDPGLHFGQVLRIVLTAEGVRVGGNVVRERVRLKGDGTPENGNVVAICRTPIAKAMTRAGKDSLGMMAEALIKSVGQRQSGVGTWESGRAAVRTFLQKAGAKVDLLVIDDGSGLSRKNRMSPAAMTQVLQYMFAASPGTFDALRNCLSRAGIDGTLDDRLRGPETRGRVFAKTGYINGVRTLSGYAQTKAGKWVAFSFFYNGAASTKPLTQLQDKACELLVR